jgi:UDP-3-O-[3-hydroxymyristoyl] N-acetylglucosamine deacetylase
VIGAVAGRGLHTGALGDVRFVRHDGPVVLRSGGVETSIGALRVVDTTRSTTVADARGTLRVATIEHVFAALGGLGIHHGVGVLVEGREAPLADGGARAYVDALLALGVTPSRPALRIVRDGAIEVGASRYELRCGGGIELEVEELLARGLASHVTPESVVVIGKARILSSGAPFAADEPARHKLLDLIGDLYVYGGPPLGRLRAVRPGHAATHEVMRRAFEEGLVARK